MQSRAYLYDAAEPDQFQRICKLLGFSDYAYSIFVVSSVERRVSPPRKAFAADTAILDILIYTRPPLRDHKHAGSVGAVDDRAEICQSTRFGGL